MMNANRNGTNGTSYGDKQGTKRGPTNPEPWERLESESDGEYARYACYLHLGPTRSVRRAYQCWTSKGNEQGITENVGKAPRSWRELCAKHHWRARARAFDVWTFATTGRAMSLRYIRLLNKTIKKLDRQRKTFDKPIESWTELTHCLEVLARLIPPDALKMLSDPDPWLRVDGLPEESEPIE
jgi:hypothetical protein